MIFCHLRRCAQFRLAFILSFFLWAFFKSWGVAPAQAGIRVDAFGLGCYENLKLTQKAGDIELPSLGGGAFGLGFAVKFFKKNAIGAGLDISYFKFNSNAKLKQEQFGKVETGEFVASTSALSLTPFFFFFTQ